MVFSSCASQSQQEDFMALFYPILIVDRERTRGLHFQRSEKRHDFSGAPSTTLRFSLGAGTLGPQANRRPHEAEVPPFELFAHGDGFFGHHLKAPSAER